MSRSEWVSHNEAREIVGRAFYRDDWIGGLDQQDIDLLNGEFGPKRMPRPNAAAGFFEVIRPCPKKLRSKLDAAIGRDRRMIVQLTTVLEWLDQNGFPALEKRYLGAPLQSAVAGMAPANASTRAPSAGKRGPIKGTISRYVEQDRSMFPQMTRLIDEGMSPTAAALKLADHLKGGGAPESKASRLRKLFQRESS